MKTLAVENTLFGLIRPSSRTTEIIYLASFNLFLIATAFVSFNLPFSPVPITGQTFGVLVIGLALGRVRATAVVLAYLIEGAAGLPVFAGGASTAAVFIGPTGGYLIGFLPAAWLVGLLADKGWDKNIWRSLGAMFFGTIVIFLFGLAQLSFYVPFDSLLVAGLIPFIPGAILKMTIAAAILPSIRKFVGCK